MTTAEMYLHNRDLASAAEIGFTYLSREALDEARAELRRQIEELDRIWSSLYDQSPKSILGDSAGDRHLPDGIQKVLRGLETSALEDETTFWARPSQVAAVRSRTTVTGYLTGRGYGKTRALAAAVSEFAHQNPEARIMIADANFNSLRNGLVQELLELGPEGARPVWNAGSRKLTWPNGSVAYGLALDKPDTIRGHLADAAFYDNADNYLDATGGTGELTVFDYTLATLRQTGIPQIFLTGDRKWAPNLRNMLMRCRFAPSAVNLLLA